MPAVLEPPSESLLNLLFGMNLCSPRDLRRCRGRVRQLTRDLPAFDSVWLDALVQDRRLTSFQAKLLESSQPHRIGVGPCVLIERLGGGPAGNTYLARPRDGHEPCVVKCLANSERLSPAAIERLTTFISDLHDYAHPSLVVPHACDTVDGQLVIVSRYIPGSNLGELLVRRGRYPAAVVMEIGRQLLDGLHSLAERGFSHGDIRIANVRLTTSGVVVLVDAGVRAALDPEFTIHAGLPPERYDGIAPELIGTGLAPNVSSDLYALGCLLWQLLAGRPPFPGGNPLGKLAAHQTKRIDDVRKWAPDTPALLAETLRGMTARNPAERPASFQDALELWGRPRRSGRRQLVAFRKRFDASAQVEETATTGGSVTRWLFVFATLFAISGAAVTLADKGARTQVVALASRVSEHVQDRLKKGDQSREPGPSSPVVKDAHRVPAPRHSREVALVAEPLPAPDPQGVLHLDSAGPYLAAEINAVGPLVIRGRAEAPAEIIVADRSLLITAESLRLEHVRLKAAPEMTSASSSALLVVKAQTLEIEGCVFQSSPTESLAVSASAKSSPAAIAWRVLDIAMPTGGNATIRNSLHFGGGPLFYLASSARRIELANCLKIGGGPLFHLNSSVTPAAGRNVELHLNSVTARQSGAVVRWEIPESWKGKGRVAITAGDCVFDVRNNGAALIEFIGSRERPEWPAFVRMTGEGSLATTDATIVAWIDAATRELRPLDAGKIDLEGVSTAPFMFAGPPSARAADSVITSFEAVRRSLEPPGINTAALPAIITKQ